MRGIRINGMVERTGNTWILSFASPCMHRYQAAHVCTVCYAHARNTLRTPSNRKPPVFQFMSRPRTVWTPVLFEILVVEAFVVRGIGRARVFAFPPRILSSATRIAPTHLRITDILIACWRTSSAFFISTPSCFD